MIGKTPSAFQALLAGASTLALCVSQPATAQTDVEHLQRQIEEQQARIAEQQRQLDLQAQQMQALSRALEDLLQRNESSTMGAEANAESTRSQPPVEDLEPSPRALASAVPVQRDGVGDLNSASVVAGDFPGSFRIAGGREVSLAIGGFVKAVGIADTSAEKAGASFLPAFLGTQATERDGKFAMDASLSRLFIDGRAPMADGSVRAYVEWDFNQANNGSLSPNMRHAYGQWNNGKGTALTAGHTWSTIMNLNTLPEGLTEPTVSGAFFTRQAQLRWSQSLGSSTILNIALENPNNTDVLDYGTNANIARTRLPDTVVRLDLDGAPTKQLSIGALLRDLRVRTPDNQLTGDLAWGITASGYIVPFEGDKFVLNGVYGKGLGRYLLGIQPNSGSVIDPTTGELLLRTNWGVFSTYRHAWSDSLRSTVMAGYARSEAFDWQPDSTFVGSAYGAANLMWQVSPVITVGVEYAYGLNETKVSDQLDNHRISFGIQFF